MENLSRDIISTLPRCRRREEYLRTVSLLPYEEREVVELCPVTGMTFEKLKKVEDGKLKLRTGDNMGKDLGNLAYEMNSGVRERELLNIVLKDSATMNFLMGAVMKAGRGCLHPTIVVELIKELEVSE